MTRLVSFLLDVISTGTWYRRSLSCCLWLHWLKSSQHTGSDGCDLFHQVGFTRSSHGTCWQLQCMSRPHHPSELVDYRIGNPQLILAAQRRHLWPSGHCFQRRDDNLHPPTRPKEDSPSRLIVFQTLASHLSWPSQACSLGATGSPRSFYLLNGSSLWWSAGQNSTLRDTVPFCISNGQPAVGWRVFRKLRPGISSGSALDSPELWLVCPIYNPSYLRQRTFWSFRRSSSKWKSTIQDLPCLVRSSATSELRCLSQLQTLDRQHQSEEWVGTLWSLGRFHD